ncbi:MAG: hypothetical protein ACI9F9_003460 [Candidatus Paceibacteria bacterium]|jgi:hypothetical protein
MSDSPIEGVCLCGAVRYRITGKIKGFQYCHCSRCRKFTGSAHAANMFTSPENLSWIEGEEQVGTFTLVAEPPFPSAFCKTCGSSLPSMSSSGRYWVVPAGTLEGDPGITPARSIFWDSRAPWYKQVSDLPCHGEWPEA